MPAFGGGPSRTALVTAVVRDLCREEPPPLVLDDALALQLAGPDGCSIKHQLQAQVSHSELMAFGRWVCIRSRYSEDVMEREAEKGNQQYVILGAGLDTYALRQTHSDVRVFEVDHPATQGWKRRRLADLGIPIPESLVFVQIDFERQGLRDVLEDAGFRFGEPAVFSWLGVTMYLTLSAIDQTLATVAQGAPGTWIVLTYNQPNRVLDDHAVRITSAFQSIASGFGEPFVTFFTRDEIDDVLLTSGFHQMEHVGREEARVRYYNGNSTVEIAGAQASVSAVVNSTR